MNQQREGTSRRTLVKGVAWSVPVVAAVAAAPVASASGQCTPLVCFGGVSIHKCCGGGNNRFYWTEISFTNTSNNAVQVNFSFTISPSASGSVTFTDGGLVQPGQTRTFRVTGGTAPNCSNATYPPFTIEFNDGTNVGTIPMPGGSTGGSTCPPGEQAADDAASATEGSESTPEESESTPEDPAPAPEASPSAEAPAPDAPAPDAPAPDAPAPEAPSEPAPEASATP